MKKYVKAPYSATHGKLFTLKGIGGGLFKKVGKKMKLIKTDPYRHPKT